MSHFGHVFVLSGGPLGGTEVAFWGTSRPTALALALAWIESEPHLAGTLVSP